MTGTIVPLSPRAKTPALKVGMLIGTTSVAGGGVIEALHSLCRALERVPGMRPEVFSLQGDEAGAAHDFGSTPVHLARASGPSAFGYAPDLVSMMLARDVDVVHVHGLWMYLSVAARRWSRITGRPYLVSPHGMLDPWALRSGALKKRAARYLYENAHLRDAACLHALCEEEKRAIRQAGCSAPVAILPNGVELPAGMPPAGRRADVRTLLFLGRVTPKKKVVELVRAWRSARPRGSRWHLVIVGPAEPDYLPLIRAEIALHGAQEHVHLAGPAYGEARTAAYAGADAFILPSISEGLPMAALEAFAFGLPALLTPQCNLPEAFAAGAALSIGSDEASIALGLRNLFAMSDAEREMMGRCGHDLARGRFGWRAVAQGFASLYGRIAARSAGDVALAASDRA